MRIRGTPPKTKVTIESIDKEPFEDLSPIKDGDFSLSCYMSVCWGVE